MAVPKHQAPSIIRHDLLTTDKYHREKTFRCRACGYDHVVMDRCSDPTCKPCRRWLATQQFIKISSLITALDIKQHYLLTQVFLMLGCLKVASEAQFSCPGFGPHVRPSRSISRHIDRMFRRGFVLLRRPELTALLTRLPRA